MDDKLNVLLIEENPGDARLIRELLVVAGDGRFRLQIADDLEAGLAQLTASDVDVVLLDLSLPDRQRLESLASTHNRFPALPIILLAGQDDEPLAARAVLEGAQDYLVKRQVDGHLLVRSIRNAIDRKQNEARILHLREVLRATRDVDRLIAHERDPQRLLADACTILVQTRGYCMVWIGLIAADLCRVIPSARAGKGTEYLDRITVTLDESATGQGPTATAIRTRQPAECHDILTEPSVASWREAAQAYGFRSSIAVPMAYGARVFGAVNVYAERPAAFEREEIDLLGELAVDLAHGLQGIEDEAELRRAEKTLRESGARFSTVFRASPTPIAVARVSDRRFSDVNVAWQNMTKYTREEAIGRTPFELNSWIKPSERDQLVRTLRKHGTVQEHEFQMRQKSGAIVPILLSAELINVADETCVLAMAMDITERERAEEALRENTERMSHILEATSDGVWDWDIPSGKAVFSPRYSRMLGYEPDEFAKHYNERGAIIHPDDIERVEQARADHFYRNKEFSIEFRMLEKSERWHWIHSRGIVIERDNLGNPVRMVGAHFDIQERKETEEALRENEERFRVTFENASEAIHIDNTDDAILEVNPRMCDLMGYSREELLRMHVGELMAPEVRRSGLVIVEEFSQHGSAVFEGLNLHKNGRCIPVEISIGQIKRSSGDLYVSILRDITERKRVEERTRRQIEELQRWYGVTLDRETRTLELKLEVNDLLRLLKEPIRYPSAER
jgi:PAS domain S-box-containing protein